MSKKIIIITTIIIVILIILLIFLFQYFKNDYSNVNINTNDIMNNIYSSLESDIPSLLQLDEDGVKEKYNIDTTKLENYVIKIPLMNIRADEIAIIKVKNISDVEYIKNKLNERLKVIQSTFEGYLQDQYELAKNPLIISKGKYILMSISENNDEIEKIFNSYFVSENRIYE